MAYYDPVVWIAPDDQLVSYVEHTLKLSKRVRSKQSSSGKSFLPLLSVELDVVVEDTNESLRLVEWIDREGKIFINLSYSEDIFRKGHFKQDWHTNPNGAKIRPPHHMHFPTIKYCNLDRRHTYAYPINADIDIDYVNALKKFCDYINTRLEGVSIPLLWRRVEWTM